MSLDSLKIDSSTDLQTANAIDRGLVAMCFTSENQTEGIKAFIEKRVPRFKGRQEDKNRRTIALKKQEKLHI